MAQRRKIPSRIRFRLIALAIFSLSSPTHLFAGQPSSPCDSNSQALLSCVSGLIRELGPVETSAASVLSPALKEPLDALTKREGYDGVDTDVQVLRKLSTTLKSADRKGNYDAISTLDNAIASFKEDLRAALSPRAIALQSKVGAEIQPDFARRKLNFLKSAKGEFYNDGPFDLIRRGLLAGAIEDNYFLARRASAGKDELRAQLRDELAVINDVIERYRSSDYDILIEKQRTNRKLQVNSNIFWRATVSFLLGDAATMRSSLQELATQNQKFDLNTNDISTQLYIYRLFNEPYSIRVIDDGSSLNFQIKDDNILRRLYNAAQLAVLTCGFLKEGPALDEDIAALKQAVVDFDFHDYSVIAAKGADQAEMKKLGDAIGRSLQQPAAREKFAKLKDRLDAEAKPFATAMKLGAEKCAIANDTRDAIYSAFVPQPQVKQTGSSWYITFGGTLSVGQAKLVAEFLQDAVAGDLPSQSADGKGFSPYPARTITN